MSTKFTKVAFSMYAGSPARYSPLPAFRGLYYHYGSHVLTDDSSDVRAVLDFLVSALYRSGCSRVFLCFSGHRFIVQFDQGGFFYVKCC